MRIVLFTGRGGSGVSTVAAATAAAAAGRRTLAFAFGPGLAAALGAPLSGHPQPLADNLSAVEARLRPDAADPFRDWLRDLLDWRNMDQALADDLAALPGLSYIGRLLELEAFVQQGDFELIVVDGPPLGQLEGVLAGVDAAARWLDRLFPERQPNVFEPFLRALTAYSSGGEDVYEQGRDLLLRLARLRDLLTDADTSSVRLVLTADEPSLAAAQRAISALALFAYPVDAAVVGRLLPSAVSDPFFAGHGARQQEALRYIADALAPMPALAAELAPEGPVGLDSLARLAAAVYGDLDPTAVLYRGPVHAFAQRDGHHEISLALPFARREELDLEQDDDGLVVHLGGLRRIIALPPQVRHLDAVSSFDGATLTVTFGAG